MPPFKTKKTKVTAKKSGVRKTASRKSSTDKTVKSKKKAVGSGISDPNELGSGRKPPPREVEETPAGIYPILCPAEDCPDPMVVRAEWLAHCQIFHNVEVSKMECPYPGKLRLFIIFTDLIFLWLILFSNSLDCEKFVSGNESDDDPSSSDPLRVTYQQSRMYLTEEIFISIFDIIYYFLVYCFRIAHGAYEKRS